MLSSVASMYTIRPEKLSLGLKAFESSNLMRRRGFPSYPPEPTAMQVIPPWKDDFLRKTRSMIRKDLLESPRRLEDYPIYGSNSGDGQCHWLPYIRRVDAADLVHLIEQ